MSSAKDGSIEIAGVRLSSPEKVLFEEQGVTKRELAEYYSSIAKWVVPELKDRPLTLLRCPQGHEGKCFVQRRVGEGFPAYLHRVPVSVEGEEGVEHIAVDSIEGVIYLVQIGVLEIHSWGARRDRLDRPDRIVFDLDPDPSLPFSTVVDAAEQIRSRLGGLGLRSFVKTTGGKGLHVVAPLARTASWDEVKGFSRALAEEMEGQEPAHFVAEASKALRVGKIFVDYVRNGAGATSIASYSTRAREGAPASTPISWEELADGIDPLQFNVRTVPARLKKLRRHPWGDYTALRQSLTKTMRAAVTAT